MLRSDPGTARCDPNPVRTGVITKDGAKEALPACLEEETDGLVMILSDHFSSIF